MISATARFSYWLVAVLVGYGLGTSTLADLERVVGSLVIPLYVCLVSVYLTARLYFIAFEPRLEHRKSKLNHEEDEEALRLAKMAKQPIDLTGAFKLVENDNFEAFLAAQGVPWALRGAANKARPTHRITHYGNVITIKIEGIIESQTTYTIEGPPVRGLVRGRLFEDKVVYIQSGICTMKRACDDGYTVKVQRALSKDRNEIQMTSTVTFDDKLKQEIECRQLFQRRE